MNNIQQKLNEVSAMSRLEAIESAYAGNAAGGSNFKARWKGFDSNGRAQVEVDGQIYTGTGIGSRAVPGNYDVMLRVGKGVRDINW
jgi:hypothetical protein